ncbi:MAG TPA: 4-(cytidine 5'-diphospho)-2-C-methyl-D-erythritol kinase [Mobilitalea sp.]|nr:4-(cytidine 5'-diphospho)-2-C-methyl-D-erythritol kinase [Mobilitalea sp.]
MNYISMKAYAKINLGLDVLRKREDGYHDVSMIMQSINLYDTLSIKKYNDGVIKVRTNLPYLPNDRRNLVYKATTLFNKTMKINAGIRIILKKNIPVAAGLAGGSSDAAAVLLGLNKLFNTGLSTSELMQLGVQLGADVPYCILLGTALSEGIGELLTPLKPIPECTILLVKPDISVSTKYVYEGLKLDSSIIHPDIKGMLDAIEEGSLLRLTSLMDNILQTVTVRDYPVIEEIKEKMMEKGALTSLMSGSGPTVFGIFNNQEMAETAYRYFAESTYGGMVKLTKPYQPKNHAHFQK